MVNNAIRKTDLIGNLDSPEILYWFQVVLMFEKAFTEKKCVKKL